MSAVFAQPDLHEYVDHLTPAQQHHLRLIINTDKTLPPISEAISLEDDDPVLGLIGAIKDSDIPDDFAQNAGFYASNAAWRRHLDQA